jgi:hypothetical protein
MTTLVYIMSPPPLLTTVKKEVDLGAEFFKIKFILKLVY